MRSEISFRYKHRAFIKLFRFWHLTFSCNFRGQSWTGVLHDAILMGLKQTSEYKHTENNVRKRAQRWVFRISRSLRYISDFLVLKLAIDGNFPGHSFSSFISFSVLPRPTTLSVITEVSLLPCWQMFMIDIWGIMLSAWQWRMASNTWTNFTSWVPCESEFKLRGGV